MLVVDAGPLIAASDVSEEAHERCRQLLHEAPGPLVVPTLAVAEAAYFLRRRLGAAAELALAASIQAGDLLPEPVDGSDWTRICELLAEYSDLGLGITDASVLAACERLGATKLATLDHRRFSVVRPRHCAALTLTGVISTSTPILGASHASC